MFSSSEKSLGVQNVHISNSTNLVGDGPKGRDGLTQGACICLETHLWGFFRSQIE